MEIGKTFAIIGIIARIMGFFFLWVVFAPLAIIFGARGILAKNNAKGLGIIGIVLGIIDVVTFIILFFINGSWSLFLF